MPRVRDAFGGDSPSVLLFTAERAKLSTLSLPSESLKPSPGRWEGFLRGS